MRTFIEFFEKYQILVLVVLSLMFGLLSALLSGDPAYNFQGFVIGFFRFAQLMLWACVCGWINDYANGTPYREDRKIILEGNVAVALTRTGGFAALYIGGALLLTRL